MACSGDSTLFRPRVKLFICRKHGVCAADGMLRSFGVINATGGVVVGQRDAMLFHHGVGVGDGGQQTLGVRMNRVGENLLLRTGFHHVAQIHHRDAVGDVFDDVQIVRDEQVRQPHALLQIVQEVDHLRLNRHIQRGNALVGDNQPGVHNQGAGNADALTLTAGKLVRIAGSVLRRKSDFLKHFADFLLALLPIGEAVVDVHAFADDVADLLARIQTRHRVLENHLHIRAEHTARVAVKHAGNHLAVEGDATVRWVIQADDAAPDAGGRKWCAQRQQSRIMQMLGNELPVKHKKEAIFQSLRCLGEEVRTSGLLNPMKSIRRTANPCATRLCGTFTSA